jgi:signal transduction histidine kinase
LWLVLLVVAICHCPAALAPHVAAETINPSLATEALYQDYAIVIAPPFWGTWWFQGAAVLLLLGGTVGAYRWRVRSIEARSRELEAQVQQRTAELRREMAQRAQIEEALRQSEMEKAVTAERNRLARELHDAVTQTLFSASLIAEVLPRVWQADQKKGRQQLEEVRLLREARWPKCAPCCWNCVLARWPRPTCGICWASLVGP